MTEKRCSKCGQAMPISTRTSKRCPRCGETKPIGAFNRSRPAPDGRQGWCALCYSVANRAWRASRPDYIEAYNAERRAEYVKHGRQGLKPPSTGFHTQEQ